MLTIQVSQTLQRRLYKATILELDLSAIGTTAEEALHMLAQNLTTLCASMDYDRAERKTGAVDLTDIAKVIGQEDE